MVIIVPEKLLLKIIIHKTSNTTNWIHELFTVRQYSF